MRVAGTFRIDQDVPMRTVRSHRLLLVLAFAATAVGALLVALAIQPGRPEKVAMASDAAATASPAPSSPELLIASAKPLPTPLPTSTLLPSGVADLTGMAVGEAFAHRLPIAVMIDDNRVARP